MELLIEVGRIAGAILILCLVVGGASFLNSVVWFVCGVHEGWRHED